MSTDLENVRERYKPLLKETIGEYYSVSKQTSPSPSPRGMVFDPGLEGLMLYSWCWSCITSLCGIVLGEEDRSRGPEQSILEFLLVTGTIRCAWLEAQITQ